MNIHCNKKGVAESTAIQENEVANFKGKNMKDVETHFLVDVKKGYLF